MNGNTGGPAFPGLRDIRHPSEAHFDHEEGMTLRAYFAAHAPEVPGTFLGRYLPYQGPAAPNPRDLGERDRKIAEDWLRDPCYELAGHGEVLAAFQKQQDAYFEAKTQHENQSQIQRMIAWRWHYADLMIAAGG